MDPTLIAAVLAFVAIGGIGLAFTGGANQPGAIRFLYRGFGSQEQRLQP